MSSVCFVSVINKILFCDAKHFLEVSVQENTGKFSSQRSVISKGNLSVTCLTFCVIQICGLLFDLRNQKRCHSCREKINVS